MIQREIERVGVTTVSVSLVKEFTKVVKPPRALWVPFPFGRPLGAPNEVELQRRVLLAALSLTGRDRGPVLEDFELQEAEQQFDARYQTIGRKCGPKGCSLEDRPRHGAPPVSQPARYEGDFEKVRSEIAELARSHAEYRRTSGGRTQVGSSGVSPNGITQAAELVHRFVIGEPIDTPSSGDQRMTTALFVRLSIDDIKAYYLEAKTALASGSTLDAAEANDWFWLETQAGRLIIAARDRIIETTNRAKDPNWIVARAIVPRGYGASGYTMTHLTGESASAAEVPVSQQK